MSARRVLPALAVATLAVAIFALGSRRARAQGPSSMQPASFRWEEIGLLSDRDVPQMAFDPLRK